MLSSGCKNLVHLWPFKTEIMTLDLSVKGVRGFNIFPPKLRESWFSAVGARAYFLQDPTFSGSHKICPSWTRDLIWSMEDDHKISIFQAYESERHRPALAWGLFSAVLILPGPPCKFSKFVAHSRSKKMFSPLPFWKKINETSWDWAVPSSRQVGAS